MKILITGATGYIGRRVLRRLCGYDGVEVLSVVRNVAYAEQLLPFAHCRHIAVKEMLDAVVSFQPEVVVHLATLSTSRNDSEIIRPLVEANLLFGTELLDAVRLAGSVRRFVNVGSFAEFRDGISQGISDAYLYTASKSAYRHIVDYYSRLCGFRYITAVPFTVYGGEDTAKKLMDYMIASIDAVEAVVMSPGEQILDFVHVDDVARFFAEVVTASDRWGEQMHGTDVYLGTGHGVRVRDLARKIEALVGRRLNIEWGGLPYREMDVMYAVAPIEKNNFPWRAEISLEEGIIMNLKAHGINI